jgi:hypothetical protein
MKKSITIMATGFAAFVLSLVLYIRSFVISSDEYGTSVSFSKDYLVLIILSLLLIGIGISVLMAEKGKTNKAAPLLLSFIFGLIAFIYFLGDGIKGFINGEIDKGLICLLLSFLGLGIGTGYFMSLKDISKGK